MDYEYGDLMVLSAFEGAVTVSAGGQDTFISVADVTITIEDYSGTVEFIM